MAVTNLNEVADSNLIVYYAACTGKYWTTFWMNMLPSSSGSSSPSVLGLLDLEHASTAVLQTSVSISGRHEVTHQKNWNFCNADDRTSHFTMNTFQLRWISVLYLCCLSSLYTQKFRLHCLHYYCHIFPSQKLNFCLYLLGSRLWLTFFLIFLRLIELKKTINVMSSQITEPPPDSVREIFRFIYDYFFLLKPIRKEVNTIKQVE